MINSRSLLLVVLGMFLAIGARCESFTAIGEAWHSNRWARFRCEFRIAVKECNWAMEIIPKLGVTNIPRILLFSSGADVACYMYFSHTMTETEGIVLLEHNDSPAGNCAKLDRLIWLTYASRCFLDKMPTNRLKPISELDDRQRRNGFTAPARIDRVAGSGLPRNITWYFDRSEWDSSLKSGKLFTPLKETYDLQWVWSTFAASGYNKYDGLELPSEVVYKGYGTDVTNSSQIRFVHESKLKLHRVEAQALPELFDTVFHGRATVDDRRLVKPERLFGATYRITNSSPFSVTDGRLIVPQAEQEFQEKLREQNSVRPPSSRQQDWDWRNFRWVDPDAHER